MKKAWWKESVVYQIYPRSFQDSDGDGLGDIPGIITRLDYLQELSIDVIWLSPVYDSPNDDNGYDIRHHQQIMRAFGTMNDWELLLQGIHARGMKLIMDLVVNHTSDEHEWFVKSRSNKDSDYRDYYIWKAGQEGQAPNQWGSIFGGSAWEYDDESSEYYLHLFSRKQPDLNWKNENLREDIYHMMRWWLDKGVDGFRMDVINLIAKNPDIPEEGFMNRGPVHDYLQEMNEKVLAHYDIMTVGETPGVTPEQAMDYVAEGRKELQMLFQFEHVDVTHGHGGKWDVIPFDLIRFKQIISKWQYELHEKGWNSLYLGNHDQPRSVSRFGDDGEYRVRSAKMLATLLFTLQGTPYIYQGEEIGMTNVQFPSIEDYQDIETLNMYRERMGQAMGEDKQCKEALHEQLMAAIYEQGRDNARTPMQWNDSEQAGFSTTQPWLKVNPNYTYINAQQALQDPLSIFYYYKNAIKLRRQFAVFVYGDFQLLFGDDPHIFSYYRHFEGDRLLVMLNFSCHSQTFTQPQDLHYFHKQLLLVNLEGVQEHDPLDKVLLQPFEARVYRLV